MRFYIIHPPKTKDYFEKVRAIEKQITESGGMVLNPLPVNVETQNPDYDIINDFRLNFHKINTCAAVCAMDGYAKTDLGNKAMAEAMVQKKIIFFE